MRTFANALQPAQTMLECSLAFSGLRLCPVIAMIHNEGFDFMHNLLFNLDILHRQTKTMGSWLYKQHMISRWPPGG